MIADALDWLRADLAADRDRLAAMSPTDYLRAAVDTVLAPGLWARTTLHACVYAINHAEPGAVTTYSVARRPIEAACWRPRDDIQASLLGPIAVGLLATPLASLPADPVLTGLVVLQALPLACDPLAALAFTTDLGPEDQP